MEPDTGVQGSHVIALPNKPYLDSSHKLSLDSAAASGI
jgi:hypothetical protein